MVFLKIIDLKNFANYHGTSRHLTKNCKDLINIIQEFINQKGIRIDDTLENKDSGVGLVHPNNSQLGIFKDPLLKPTKGCIGMVSTSNYF